MNNTKTSYSLSKLKFKKTSQNITNQRAVKLPLIRRKNHSQLSNNSSNRQGAVVRNDSQKQDNLNVQNQYYATDMNYKDKSNQLQSLSRAHDVNLALQIEEQMKRIIDNSDYLQHYQISNIVIQESDVDQQFQEKIMQNKQLLKMQREKNMNSQSQKQLKKDKKSQNKLIKNSTKKLSLIQQNKEKQHFKRLKSKSLFPQMKNLSLKTVKGTQHKPFTKVRQNSRQKTQEDQIIFDDDNNKETQRKIVDEMIERQNSAQKIQNKIKIDKKIAEIKIESKLSNLKHRISQRTSTKQLKNRNSFQQYKDNNIIIKSPRNSEHTVFDGIQDFLSNPHEKGSKSQRKFLKSYQKATASGQRVKLQQKIELLQTKLKSLSLRNNNEEADRTQQKSDKIIQIQNIDDASTKQTKKSYEFSDYGTMEWRRLDKKGKKTQLLSSSFEQQLKYINSLQKKNEEVLGKYIQNQKTLFELNLLNKAKQLKLKPGQLSGEPNTLAQNYTSM